MTMYYDTTIITEKKIKILPIVLFMTTMYVGSENEFTMHIFWGRSLLPLLRVGTTFLNNVIVGKIRSLTTGRGGPRGSR